MHPRTPTLQSLSGCCATGQMTAEFRSAEPPPKPAWQIAATIAGMALLGGAANYLWRDRTAGGALAGAAWAAGAGLIFQAAYA